MRSARVRVNAAAHVTVVAAASSQIRRWIAVSARSATAWVLAGMSRWGLIRTVTVAHAVSATVQRAAFQRQRARIRKVIVARRLKRAVGRTDTVMVHLGVVTGRLVLSVQPRSANQVLGIRSSSATGLARVRA